MKRRRLGQHYLTDARVIADIVDIADIKPTESVLEIGTGRGALTKELAGLGASFTGYEIDRGNFAETKKVIGCAGAEVVLADAFGQDPEFDVLVSSLPYSESVRFIRWLCSRDFVRAVVVLQEDFAEKIMSAPGSRDYRGVSALSQMAFEIEAVGKVPRASFDPPPRVGSVIVTFRPRKRVPQEEMVNVIRLFSLRRRQVDSALTDLGFKGRRSYGKRRVSSLTPKEVHAICKLPDRQ